MEHCTEHYYIYIVINLFSQLLYFKQWNYFSPIFQKYCSKDFMCVRKICNFCFFFLSVTAKFGIIKSGYNFAIHFTWLQCPKPLHTHTHTHCFLLFRTLCKWEKFAEKPSLPDRDTVFFFYFALLYTVFFLGMNEKKKKTPLRKGRLNASDNTTQHNTKHQRKQNGKENIQPWNNER